MPVLWLRLVPFMWKSPRVAVRELALLVGVEVLGELYFVTLGCEYD